MHCAPRIFCFSIRLENTWEKMKGPCGDVIGVSDAYIGAP